MGWDLPTEMIPSNALKSIILSLVEGEQVLSGGSELDSHANMVVLGKHCSVISCSKQSVNGSVFANDIVGLKMFQLLMHCWLVIAKKQLSPTSLWVVMHYMLNQYHIT